MVLECAGEALIIDAGVMFPEQRALGVDLLIPEMGYLDRRRIGAVVLTHLHDDHIGALPFLLKRYPVPVYGSELTLAVVRQRLAGARAGPRMGLAHDPAARELSRSDPSGSSRCA